MEELLRVLMFIGDDWAEDHHDLEIEDETGRRLAKARLPEGLEGISRPHALVAERPGGMGGTAKRGSRKSGVRRDRDRPRPVGDGIAGGRLPGVRDQPVVLGAVSRAVLHLWRQKRRR